MAFQRSTNDRVSPVRQQYQNIKREYPGHVLFFRLGDFYELFDDDAEIGARELDLVLTNRPVSRTERVAMAGIPHHVLDTYVSRLVAKGYPVAVCEQTDERDAPGLIRREVTVTFTASDPNADVTFTDVELDAMPFGGVLPGAYDELDKDN